MQEKNQKIPFCMQIKKNAFHHIFQNKVVFDPRPSFHFWSCGLGPRASPGNNRNNFQPGRKEMEFQMKDEQEVGALMAMPQGCARAFAILFLSTHGLPVLSHLEAAGRAAASHLFVLRVAGAASASGARGPFKSYTSRAAV